MQRQKGSMMSTMRMVRHTHTIYIYSNAGELMTLKLLTKFCE